MNRLKNKLLIFCLICVSFLFGCQAQGSNASAKAGVNGQLVEEGEDIPVTYLFSNDEKIEEESSYYDAVLEFNRTYPGLMKFKDIVTMEDAYLVELYYVDVFPTLIVVYDTDEILRIEGFKNSKEIFTELMNFIVPAKNHKDI